MGWSFQEGEWLHPPSRGKGMGTGELACKSKGRGFLWLPWSALSRTFQAQPPGALAPSQAGARASWPCHFAVIIPVQP